jgi:hypothetical protein
VTGETCASGDWRQAYANYLVKYIQFYESAGITLDMIGFLNEPEYVYASLEQNFIPKTLILKPIARVMMECSLMAIKRRRSFHFFMMQFKAPT